MPTCPKGSDDVHAAAIENAVLGAVCAAAAASVSIKILTRYFQTKTLTPFAIYCAAVGLLSLIALG
jgi:undecaprenyl pyrophosphate phosphatase UppP